MGRAGDAKTNLSNQENAKIVQHQRARMSEATSQSELLGRACFLEARGQLTRILRGLDSPS